MNLTITWINQNTDEDGTYVYRDTQPINKDNLPPPIDTLPPGVTEYVDTDVTRGQQYYYRVGIFKGEDLALSDNILAKASTYTGPGPNEFMVGDWECGLFGFVNDVDFITGATLKETLQVGGTATRPGPWIKFAYKGKVLYYLPRGAARGISFNHLSDLNLVDGSRTILIGEDEFKVRIMQGWVDGVSAPTMSGAYAFRDPPPSNEWDDLIGKMIPNGWGPDDPNKGIFGDFTVLLIPHYYSSGNGNHGYLYPALCYDGRQHVIRGGYYSRYYYYSTGWQRNSASSNTLTTGVKYLDITTTTSSYVIYAPVLELSI